MPFYFYMKVTGTSQGGFAKDSSRGDEQRALCYRFRFKGTTDNDPTGHAPPTHDPICVLKAWGPSSPQLMQAFWNKEVLKEVVFQFVRSEAAGHEETPFEEIVLKNATIASIDRNACAKHAELPDDLPSELEEIGFRFEEMTHRNVPGKTVAKYEWKKRK